jgi:hypothetical protein
MCGEEQTARMDNRSVAVYSVLKEEERADKVWTNESSSVMMRVKIFM